MTKQKNINIVTEWDGVSEPINFVVGKTYVCNDGNIVRCDRVYYEDSKMRISCSNPEKNMYPTYDQWGNFVKEVENRRVYDKFYYKFSIVGKAIFFSNEEHIELKLGETYYNRYGLALTLDKVEERLFIFKDLPTGKPYTVDSFGVCYEYGLTFDIRYMVNRFRHLPTNKK